MLTDNHLEQQFDDIKCPFGSLWAAHAQKVYIEKIQKTFMHIKLISVNHIIKSGYIHIDINHRWILYLYTPHLFEFGSLVIKVTHFLIFW